MTDIRGDDIRARLDEVYRSDSRKVFATLVRLLGDFDRAEEAMHDAFAAAMEKWPQIGVPENPAAWLVSAGRFRAIDAKRKRDRLDASMPELVKRADPERTDALQDDDSLEDDQLRLIFTCCHPALAPESQVALTLREVCGLTTEEIASAFLTAPSAIAQRIVRGKAKIRDAGIPYQIPSATDLPGRLESVSTVVYLVFNEGYAASSGDAVTRKDLTSESIRLGRLLVELVPEPEVMGLLALMLLQESRRDARTAPNGDLILLDEQDRSLWNREHIAEGKEMLVRALATRRIGPYIIQAAIAAVHADASDSKSTDWAQIVALYDVLARLVPSPVVDLNRAVAIGMRDGPEAGLAAVDAVAGEGGLDDYHLLYAARADLCRTLGRREEARESYEKALRLTQQEPERRFLEKRLREI